MVRTYLPIIIIVIALLVLYGSRINYPNKEVFDEVYHSFSSKEFLRENPLNYDPKFIPPMHQRFYAWDHPPLGKFLMSLGVSLEGGKDYVLGARVSSLVFGVATALLTMLTGLILFKRKSVAFLAVFLFTFDFLPFVQARMGMLDIYLMFFNLLAFLLFYLYLAKAPKLKNWAKPTSFQEERTRTYLIMLTGLVVGLAGGVKLSGFFPLVPFLAILFCRRNFLPSLILLGGAFLAYLVTFFQFFYLGKTLVDFFELHKNIWERNVNLTAPHDYVSPWWSWPMDFRPVWYSVTYSADKVENIYAMGNPAIWWVSLPLMIYLGWLSYRKRILSTSLIVMGFLASWLPWAFVSRPTFIYYFLPSLPFLYLGLAYLLSILWKKRTKWLVSGYLILVVWLFIYFYPLLASVPVSQAYLEEHFWFSSWR